MTIENLYKDLTSTIKWKLVVDNKIVDNTEENWSFYRTLSPMQVENLQAGICYDFAAYAQYRFQQEFPDIETKLYWIEYDKSHAAHTWLAYIENDWIYSFEPHGNCVVRGIRAFKDENEMIDFYGYEFTKNLKDQSYTIYSYKQPQYGLTKREFTNRIIFSGEKLADNLNYYQHYIINRS